MQGLAFAKEHGLVFMETSAKTAANVEEVRRILAPETPASVARAGVARASVARASVARASVARAGSGTGISLASF